MALVAALCSVGTQPAQAVAAATTTITVDGGQSGRTFDGIGAISGGGGNSRLLRDYPAAQRSQILDYLFKPGYGANLQLLKLEIGGDANSTDGAEPSIEHTEGQINCDAGYEFWLAEQAKSRNPDLKLYGLAWAAPGWISGGFWSTDTINYLISWLGCAKQHGLPISYLGGWNERGHDVNWYIQLRSALDSAGYGSVQIVGDDSGWSVADDMASNSAFNNAVSVIGAHYPCTGGDGGSADTCSSTTTAKNNGKPLWASENGSLDMDSGAPALIRSIVRGYVDARMTAYLNWPLVAAIYPNLPFSTVGLATANSPWSGNYAIGEDTWATAQVTQFAQPGWTFIDSASGYLGGTDNSSFSADQIGVGVVGYQTDQFDNLSVTTNPPGNHAGILKGRQSGLCADVPGASRTNGTQLALWDCNDATNQAWTLTPAGQLTVYDGTKCLDAKGGATTDGTPVQIYDCDGTAAEKWTVNSDGSVVNPASGKCLDATAGGTTPGTLLELWTCTGGTNQSWLRGAVSAPLKGQESGRCVDVPGANQANGTKPALWDCNGGTHQTWTSTTTNQLTVYDSKCLEVTGGATTDGSPVEIWDCNGGAHQQWRVRSDGSVVNVGSGKCLDAVGHGTANSTALEIWTCTGGANQNWRRS
ncbi:ricin-type beta-trefoil lectin domain protein [Streptomyces sp. STR69]|uniref:ricin-type beta-trefoil lectin domain protein n=1 Tax=Streptomyces sp. STR69 TaxID=1796942 RepID=UPI0021C73787|nr:ricin-type beta-trefoil lectin domain protein [Streptomyces sp. STR69]